MPDPLDDLAHIAYLCHDLGPYGRCAHCGKVRYVLDLCHVRVRLALLDTRPDPLHALHLAWRAHRRTGDTLASAILRVLIPRRDR